MTFAHRLHLDYETASEENLKTAGAYRYAAHPSTRILMLGWALDDEPEELWEPHLDPTIPPRLLRALTDDTVAKHAFNALFERLITRHCLNIDIPAKLWRCTMVEAYYLGFAGGLDAILKAVGLEPKDDKGKRLINTFCTPAPKNHHATRYDWENKPIEWELFCGYCRQDVRVERALYHWIHKFPSMHQWDWSQWFLDQKINDNGVPMDREMAHSAVQIWDEEKRNLADTLREMTGLEKVTRGPFLEWIKQNTGVELESTRKDYLAALLTKGELPETARPYVEIWAQKEGKAVSKYNAVINATGNDGRARGMFQYKGASRTDRAGGRIIQLQNLKRPFVDQNDLAIENVVNVIKCRDPQFINNIYNMPVSQVLGGAIRHVINAREGHTFAICDLSSIESVVLGWVSDCPLIDQTFRAGKDSYKMFASKYYGIEYEEVTKEQRGFSKPPVLGCGFMLGWRGLVAYAEGYGVEMTQDQAKNAVDTFRTMYPEIPRFWKWINEAVKAVTLTGIPVSGFRLSIERDADFLRIWLPSGRALSYFSPQVNDRKAPWSKPTMYDSAPFTYEQYKASGWEDDDLIAHSLMKPYELVANFNYMGMNDKNQWTRIYAHAGLITENIVQSIAGDLLWSGLVNADGAGLPIVLHVHDEIAVEVPIANAHMDVKILEECMTRRPAWAQDMWLGAGGFITKRYTKD